jgi:hypothetical protein
LDILKVATVYQPWASLIAIQAKPFEFRGWVPPRPYVGSRIAIHAAAREIVDDEVDELIADLRGPTPWTTCLRSEIALPFLEAVVTKKVIVPLSAILCTAILGMPRHGSDIARDFGMPAGSLPNDSDRDEHANYGWPLADIDVVMPPVSFRGKQGWGEVSAGLLGIAEVAA